MTNIMKRVSLQLKQKSYPEPNFSIFNRKHLSEEMGLKQEIVNDYEKL